MCGALASIALRKTFSALRIFSDGTYGKIQEREIHTNTHAMKSTLLCDTHTSAQFAGVNNIKELLSADGVWNSMNTLRTISLTLCEQVMPACSLELLSNYHPNKHNVLRRSGNYTKQQKIVLKYIMETQCTTQYWQSLFWSFVPRFIFERNVKKNEIFHKISSVHLGYKK